MKSKIIKLLVAIGIVCAFLLIVTGINILVVILSNKIEFDLNYVLIPILIAWAIWSVYGIINKIENNKEDSHE
jgi:hypothetical protein